MTTLREALDALASAGVAHELRRQGTLHGLPEHGELDLWVEGPDLPAAETALREAGFRHVAARGRGRHRFYVAHDRGRWSKLDVKIPTAGLPAMWDRSTVAAVWRAAVRRWPLSGRRRGPVLAILGPDGAGKGSAIQALRDRIPLAVRVVYLGARGPDGTQRRGAGASPPGFPLAPAVPAEDPDRVAGNIRQVAFVLRKWLRAWIRLGPAYAAAWRGTIVLCDRHPLDVLAVDPDRTRTAAALERFLCRELVPRPDAIVVLDAPSEILSRRKAEHPAATLERWRHGYADAFAPLGAVTVATTGSRKSTADQVSQLVWRAFEARQGW